MATVIVAQASDPGSLWPRLNELADLESLVLLGDDARGTFRRDRTGRGATRRPLHGRYHVKGSWVKIEAEEELAPSVVFVRLARVGLHLISYR